MQKAWVWSLGQENSLELEMATHSSILAQKIPRAEEPGGLQSMGLQRVGHGGEPEHIHMSISVHCSASHLHSVFTSYIARSGHHCTKKKEWLPSSRPSPMPDICHLLCWLFLCKCTKCVMFHAGVWRPRPPGNFPLRISEQTFLSTSRYLLILNSVFETAGQLWSSRIGLYRVY